MVSSGSASSSVIVTSASAIVAVDEEPSVAFVGEASVTVNVSAPSAGPSPSRAPSASRRPRRGCPASAPGLNVFSPLNSPAVIVMLKPLTPV